MAKQDEFVMPVHFKRFIAATQDWTDEEVGCYFRLLMHQWGKNSIPKELHRQKRITDSVEKNHWIVEQKFKEVEAGLQNQDMEEIRAERKVFSELQKQRREGNNRNSTGSSPKHPPESNSGTPSGEDSGLGLEEEISNKDKSFEKSEKLLNPNGETSLPLEMLKIWELEKPNYAVDRIKDLPALWGIHLFIIEQVKKARGDPHFETVVDSEILDLWQQLIHEMLKDKFWCNKSLTTLGNSIQEFWNKANKNGNKADSQKRNIRKLEDLLGYGGQNVPHAN